MSSTLTEASSRLPEIMNRLQGLSPKDLEVVERVLMQLEINRTVDELDDVSDDLRANGMMARLPEIIREVRERHRTTMP